MTIEKSSEYLQNSFIIIEIGCKSLGNRWLCFEVVVEISEHLPLSSEVVGKSLAMFWSLPKFLEIFGSRWKIFGNSGSAEPIACEQTHLWVTCASERQRAKRSSGSGSLAKRCQESEPALMSVSFSFLLHQNKVKCHWSKSRKGAKTVNLLCLTRSN